MHFLYHVLTKVREKKLYFSLSSNRENVITINVVVPGQRIEIDVFSNEDVDVAVFKGDEVVSTDKSFIDSLLNDLIG